MYQQFFPYIFSLLFYVLRFILVQSVFFSSSQRIQIDKCIQSLKSAIIFQKMVMLYKFNEILSQYQEEITNKFKQYQCVFYNEYSRKYGNTNVWKYLSEFFDYLPQLQQLNYQVFCHHISLLRLTHFRIYARILWIDLDELLYGIPAKKA
ncbi:unnamed protein product (macronuclear) [Paramecium tetraurelia]|uniref:Transmembrane protein n=1 Tax=Paramecium tetraurelia TaxID=5888 RepID=A0C258_PARTE|nr:uncharacterized protein GSPATT00034352001 [Paramecium tetraurelia]CAK64875.1 unnamed protein product [Paramecium tetraurelia]|eukprot:XP_001432272.1 hypothetical protein (macronuclear) [Paramecium tetraurelia strain d4-2]